MIRRFEFVSGNSAKFWEIKIGNTDVTVRYGRLGTDGQVQTKSFATADKASQHADRVIGEKLRKGYAECAVR